MEYPAIWLVWFKRVGKILFVFVVPPAFYIASFYFAFSDTFVWGAGAATSRSKEPSYKYIVGPTPNGFFIGGTPDRGAANGIQRYTGEEWPFVVYRPLVVLYNRRTIPEYKAIEDELIKHRADLIR